MKIYKADGTFTNRSDTEFGWYLDEIIVDEAVPFYEEKNEATKLQANSKIVDPITEQTPASVVDFGLKSEIVGHEVENIDEKTYKAQVLSLINPCTIESKMLLSVVHFAMYKNFDINMINVEAFQKPANLGLFTDDVIYDGIRNYSENRSNNTVPLMIDLILAHTKCDLNEISPDENLDNRDSVDAASAPKLQPVGKEASEHLNVADLTKIINERLETMSAEASKMRLDSLEIKRSLLNEMSRVDFLIRKAQILEKNLRETKFLDDLVHLLDGKLDKVVVKDCPFRIFVPPAYYNELNLIV